jgi:hypothetical protein
MCTSILDVGTIIRESSTITNTVPSIVVFTITNADTATTILTITVSTPPTRRVRAIIAPLASATLAIAGTASRAGQNDGQKLLGSCPRVLQPPYDDPFKPVLMRRQTKQSTVTVAWATTTRIITTTITLISTYRATVTYEVTTTVFSTSTTVLRAGVTVTSTTTTNIYQAKLSSGRNDPSLPATGAPAGNPSGSSTANVAAVPPPPGPSSGLSTGAKTDVSAGVSVGGSLIFALILFFWRRRRTKPESPNVTPAPIATPHSNKPEMDASTYYGTDASKSMRSLTMLPYSPQ